MADGFEGGDFVGGGEGVFGDEAGGLEEEVEFEDLGGFHEPEVFAGDGGGGEVVGGGAFEGFGDGAGEGGGAVGEGGGDTA